MSEISAVISDFGGVLTTPLLGAFQAFQDRTGIPLETLGTAMGAIWERDGAHPLFELETGRLSEPEFLAKLGSELSRQIGREVSMEGFGQDYFENLDPNHELIEYMRSLRRRGYRMAICTNNVREWEPLWRAMLPVDEIFDIVVDSAYVGVRKPDREIYDITLVRLGVEPAAAVFLDDIEDNCVAARELGLTAIRFRSNAQAIAELEAVLDERGRRVGAA